MPAHGYKRDSCAPSWTRCVPSVPVWRRSSALVSRRLHIAATHMWAPRGPPTCPAAVPTVRHGKRTTQCTQRAGTRKWVLTTGSGRSDLCRDPRKAGPRDPTVLARCMPHARVSFAPRHSALPVFMLKVLPSANGPPSTVAAAVASAVV